jgi:hypothetical protein
MTLQLAAGSFISRNKLNTMGQADIIGTCRIKPIVQAIKTEIAFQGGPSLIVEGDRSVWA